MGKETSDGGNEAVAGAAPSAEAWLGAIALIGWSGYTLLQSRAAPKASLLARMSRRS